MATTYLQAGDTITFTAAANITSGDVVELGDVLGVAVMTAASGAECEARVNGVFTMAKATGVVFTVGQKVNWDASAGNVTSATTAATDDITDAGFIVAAAATGATTCELRLTAGTGTGS